VSSGGGRAIGDWVGWVACCPCWVWSMWPFTVASLMVMWRRARYAIRPGKPLR
jgi:hypothetical protein